MNAAKDKIALDMRSRGAWEFPDPDFEAPSPKLQAPEKLQTSSFKAMLLVLCWIVICVSLSGCKSFRPVEDQARYYVLSTSAGGPAAAPSNEGVRIGLAPVQIPGYLQNTRIAVRTGTNEIYYSENRQWAERVDKGIERVLASDLSTLLRSARVISSAWQNGDVKAEVHVSIQRFELDETGQATLECEWRIQDSDTGHVLRLEHALISKKGLPLAANPTGAVSTLSQALGELSSQIAAAVKTLG
jgi:hypothetical protein